MLPTLALISLLAWSLSAQGVEVIVHSNKDLLGRDQLEGLDFSAVVRDRQVIVVEIQRPSKQFIARIDYARKSLAVKSLATAHGGAAAITADDIEVFRRFLWSAVLDRSRVADALISTVMWLSDHPPNTVVDFQTGRPYTPRPSPQGGYTSLCDSIGQPVVAQYTIDGEVQEVLVVMGPCAAEECLGRRGTGCAANPGNPAEVQRYTQECLNHDVCNRATNPWDLLGLWPPCGDEFAAATEGYFFAPDCPEC